MPFELDLPLWGHIALFAAGAAAIALAGTRLAGLADRLADRTGLGEALTGTIFLGLATALPGLAASVTAALDGHAALAIGNALGGIAIQTSFLAVADIFYTRANLEHAAASLANLMQTAVLILLVTLVLVALGGPEVTIGPVHTMTPILVAAAVFGLWISRRTDRDPMWRPEQTEETVADRPEPGAGGESLPHLLGAFALVGAIVLAAGALVGAASSGIVRTTGISESLMGGLFTASATSIPELVTTVAAVRRGALTLAVSDIVGGNFFDVLFVAAADIAYLRGSVYHADGITHREIFLGALTVLLNVVLLMGLIHRQERGPGNIGFESVLMLVLYLAGFAVLWWW